MKNLKVAKILNEIADLLELKDVEFKPRAYRKAAISVKSLSKDIEEVKEEGKLKELPGIGENIAKKIEELINTGSLKYYEDLKKEFPIDFESLLAVEGLGPKTIKILYKKLSIKNLDDLERAAKKHKIRELGGLGKKTEEKILANIKFARKKKERNLLGYIIPISENLRNELKKSKFVDKVEITGSIRRKKETIRDIDLLVITKKPEKIMDFFTNYDGVIRVVTKGKSKSTVKLKEDIQSDLRVIERKSFGAALMYFTGSKEFNVEMRSVAIKKGLKLNEYGLFKDGKQKVGKTEEEIFQRLGMTYIEPELRENGGEIEAALEGKIPKLIGYNELKGDLQMHSKWSDGSHTIEEMAKAAKGLGHDYIAITDHTDTLRIAKGMDEKTIRKQMKEIEEVDERIEGLTVLKGVEVNIDSEGKLDIKDKVLKNLDVVVASIHSGFRQGKEKLTKRIISAMDNENVDIIAHPTGRKIQERAGYDLDFEKVFEKSIETNTFLEINSYPNRLDLNDINVKRALEFGCKLVINTDSHSIEHLRYLNLGIATARRGWATKDNIINALPIKKLLKLLS